MSNFERYSKFDTLIYLDYHATTPVDPRVVETVVFYMTNGFGNASSTDHAVGDRAENAIKKAIHSVADLVGASPRDIIFTSGSTESVNLAIQGTIKNLRNNGIRPRIALSTVEHKSVLDICLALHKQGTIDIELLPVDTKAQIDLVQLEQACAGGVHLLCLMAANNEVGTIYPIDQVSHVAQRYDIPFFCDASQAVGKIPIHFNDWGITMLSLSSHKFYGPQGIGALVVKRGNPLEPILYGGGHQKGLRPGTLNLAGIVGLGDACRLRQLEMETDESEIAYKRNRLQHLLQMGIPNLVVNGDPEKRLAGNLHISIPGIPNSAVIARVRHKLAISTGSACSSGVEAPSHVLLAMGLNSDVIEGALRIGIGKFTSNEDIDIAAEILIDTIRKIQLALC